MRVGEVKNGSFNITANDEETVVQSLFFVGPVSVSFKVVDGFKDYAGGVYTHEDCGTGPMDVNHAVLATGFGYDHESKMNYYVVKNSWGDKWGDKGYFKIQAMKNMCAIAQCNSFPDIGQFEKFGTRLEEE